MLLFIFWLVLVPLLIASFLQTPTTSPKPPSTDEDVYEPKSRRPAGRSAVGQRAEAAAACPLGATRDEPQSWKRRGPSGQGLVRLPSGCR